MSRPKKDMNVQMTHSEPEGKTIAELHAEANDRAATAEALVQHAFEINKDFINQCDRDGIGMQTVTDHRKRVEKWLKAAGRTL